MKSVTQLPLTTLLGIGALVALAIVAWSYSNWRAAVKVAFVTVLIEGAIRKWILPQGQELVYFLKDVFLVGAYLKFYFAPDPELRAYRLRVPGLIIFILTSIVFLSALNPNIGSMLLAAYGVKIYYMYLPLTFMMPYLFRTREEIVRQLTWFVLLAIPICALGFLQYTSDKFSVINTFAAGTDEWGATGFGVGDRVRVTGTFSYLTGHTTFVIIFYTLAVVLLSIKETKWKWLLTGVVLPLLAGNALMGGSRASVVTMAFVTVGFMAAAMGGKLATTKNFLAVLVAGGVIAFGGAVYLFADARLHWEARSRTAGDTLRSRAIDHPLNALTMAFNDGGVFGFGIGTAHPATEAIRQRLKLARVEEKVPVFDNELGQVFVELGLVGFCGWYGLRLMLLVLSWRSFRESPPGIVRALSLAGALVTGPFLLMSVVYNHTASFLIFALAGFSLIPLLEPTVNRRFSPSSRSRGRAGLAPRLEGK